MMITTKEQIINRKIILIQKGKTGPEIAKEIGCSAPTVFLAITGKSKSILRHKQIAKALGVSLVDFWPEFYGDEVSHDSKINEVIETRNYNEEANL